MQFQLSDEQRMIQDLARAFADREIVPVAAQADRDQVFPLSIHRKALALGLVILEVPATVAERLN